MFVSLQMEKMREAQYAELMQRRERIEKLDKAGESLQLQKNCAGKGKKYKVKGLEEGKPPVFVWRAERKR